MKIQNKKNINNNFHRDNNNQNIKQGKGTEGLFKKLGATIDSKLESVASILQRNKIIVTAVSVAVLGITFVRSISSAFIMISALALLRTVLSSEKKAENNDRVIEEKIKNNNEIIIEEDKEEIIERNVKNNNEILIEEKKEEKIENNNKIVIEEKKENLSCEFVKFENGVYNCDASSLESLKEIRDFLLKATPNIKVELKASINVNDNEEAAVLQEIFNKCTCTFSKITLSSDISYKEVLNPQLDSTTEDLIDPNVDEFINNLNTVSLSLEKAKIETFEMDVIAENLAINLSDCEIHRFKAGQVKGCLNIRNLNAQSVEIGKIDKKADVVIAREDNTAFFDTFKSGQVLGSLLFDEISCESIVIKDQLFGYVACNNVSIDNFDLPEEVCNNGHIVFDNSSVTEKINIGKVQDNCTVDLSGVKTQCITLGDVRGKVNLAEAIVSGNVATGYISTNGVVDITNIKTKQVATGEVRGKIVGEEHDKYKLISK